MMVYLDLLDMKLKEILKDINEEADIDRKEYLCAYYKGVEEAGKLYKIYLEENEITRIKN